MILSLTIVTACGQDTSQPEVEAPDTSTQTSANPEPEALPPSGPELIPDTQPSPTLELPLENSSTEEIVPDSRLNRSPSAAPVSDEELRQAGLSTKEEIAALTRAYTAYEFYEEALFSIQQSLNFTPDQLLTEAELEQFSKEMCAAIEGTGGQMRLATITNFTEQTSLAKMATADEHLGGATVVAVYYECPEYIDTLNRFMVRFN